MTMSVHHDGVAVVTRLGGMRFALVGVMLTALALVAALPSITAAGVVQILAALLVGAAGACAVRVVRGVGHPSRGA